MDCATTQVLASRCCSSLRAGTECRPCGTVPPSLTPYPISKNPFESMRSRALRRFVRAPQRRMPCDPRFRHGLRIRPLNSKFQIVRTIRTWKCQIADVGMHATSIVRVRAYLALQCSLAPWLALGCTPFPWRRPLPHRETPPADLPSLPQAGRGRAVDGARPDSRTHEVPRPARAVQPRDVLRPPGAHGRKPAVELRSGCSGTRSPRRSADSAHWSHLPIEPHGERAASATAVSKRRIRDAKGRPRLGSGIPD